MLARCCSAMIDLQIPVPEFDDVATSDEAQNNMMMIDDEDPFKVMAPQELARFLRDPQSHQYDEILVLDARYDYEYRGGRIIGARNIVSLSNMTGIFERYRGRETARICIVFHCEYSHNRGPSLMRVFREHDRRLNIRNYPELTFPHIFLLDGGYKKFYSLFPELCAGGYVPMRKAEFIQNGQLKKCHSAYFNDLAGDSNNNNDNNNHNNRRIAKKPRRQSMSPSATSQFFDNAENDSFVPLEFDLMNSKLCQNLFTISASQPY